MGFFDWLDTPKKRKRGPARYIATLIHLNREGYDRRGRYWGQGVYYARLYLVEDRETGKSMHVRAASAKDAREKASDQKYGWR